MSKHDYVAFKALLPEPVGFVIRCHRTPGHLVEDGGEIISQAVVIDEQQAQGPLYSEEQMLAALGFEDPRKIKNVKEG